MDPQSHTLLINLLGPWHEKRLQSTALNLLLLNPSLMEIAALHPGLINWQEELAEVENICILGTQQPRPTGNSCMRLEYDASVESGTFERCLCKEGGVAAFQGQEILGHQSRKLRSTPLRN